MQANDESIDVNEDQNEDQNEQDEDKNEENEEEDEVVTPQDFSADKIVFGLPEIVDIKNKKEKDENEDDGEPEAETAGGNGASYTKCTSAYVNSQETEGSFLVKLPPTFCFGVNKNYKFGLPKVEKNFTGYSVGYYYQDPDANDFAGSNRGGGKNTKKKMGSEYASSAQKESLEMWKLVEKALADHLAQNADDLGDENKIELAKSGHLVTPIAKYPKKETINPKNGKKMKVVDKEKPLRTYFRLIQSKKTETFASKFYDADTDEEIHPLDLLDVRGIIEPVVKVEWVYIGDKSASFQIKLWEAFYKRQKVKPRKRVLPPKGNVRRPSSHPSDEDGDDDGSSVKVVKVPQSKVQQAKMGTGSKTPLLRKPVSNPNDDLGDGEEGDEKPKLVKRPPSVKPAPKAASKPIPKVVPKVASKPIPKAAPKKAVPKKPAKVEEESLEIDDESFEL